VVLLLYDCEAQDSRLWTSQNIKCKDKEKAMQKQGKGDVLIKERAREYLILQVCIQRN
jgi:hypothetical protein